jgi:hypothetical protein
VCPGWSCWTNRRSCNLRWVNGSGRPKRFQPSANSGRAGANARGYTHLRPILGYLIGRRRGTVFGKQTAQGVDWLQNRRIAGLFRRGIDFWDSRGRNQAGASHLTDPRVKSRLKPWAGSALRADPGVAAWHRMQEPDLILTDRCLGLDLLQWALVCRTGHRLES